VNITNQLSIRLLDNSLFLKKLVTVFAATLILVPLVYYKLYVPAGLYITALLALHLVFLYTYFTRLPWARLVSNKVGFGSRILALVFFIYLLGVLKFQGNFEVVMTNLVAGLGIHTLILFSLMAEVEKKS
jgi:hypothetical protein